MWQPRCAPPCSVSSKMKEREREAGGRPARIRREAEALLVAAERAATPAFRQQHAELWPALVAELDRRLTEACYASIYGDKRWADDDDHSVLWGRLVERPSAQAVAVKSSLGSAFVHGAVTVQDKVLSLFKKIAPQDRLQDILNDPELEGMAGKPRTSTRRPPLASPLARFDASYGGAAAGGGGGSSAGAALMEARCEVTCDEVPSAGRLVAAADMLAFTGGSGYKQRSPYLTAGRIGGTSEQAAAPATGTAAAGGRAGKRKRRGDEMGDASEQEEEESGGAMEAASEAEEEEEERGWQARLCSYSTGFYNPGNTVVLDPERGLVWAGGGEGEGRIKAFSIDRDSGPQEACSCRYTLAGSDTLLAVVGGRVLAGAKGSLLYWDIDRLTPQRHWIGADELAGGGSEGEEALEAQYGCKVLDMVDGCYNDDLLDNPEEVEVTAGDEPHGRVQLQVRELNVLQLAALGAGGGTDPQQAVVLLENSNSVWVLDWPSGRLSCLLTGQLGGLVRLAACPALPHTVTAGSCDGSVRVWDVRSAACTHMMTTRSSAWVTAVALVEDQGVPFCFTSQCGGEAVLAWDLRAPGRCLYELATGNTDVAALQWHAASRSLFAATACSYQDRNGRMHDQGALEGYRWPECMHRPSDFSHVWDAGEHLIIRYAFQDAPDLSILPEEAEPDSEAEEWSDEEEKATFRRRASPTWW